MNKIIKKIILVTSLSVLTVTMLCVFTLAPVAQAQSSGETWSGDYYCEQSGIYNCLPVVEVKPDKCCFDFQWVLFRSCSGSTPVI
jgi:hypothetical protein